MASHKRFILLVLVVTLFAVSPAAAETELVPTRYGMGISFGLAYDPTNQVDFALLSGVVLFDYDRVWPHRAPKALRFKVEGSAGVITSPQPRGIASANILALYFLDRFATPTLRPYVEAGIGVIFTDFQVEGQGLRLNFNPQAGLGVEIGDTSAPPWYLACRGHHVSNGGLYSDNRGINSVVFLLGKYF
jgi:hypothetical protein